MAFGPTALLLLACGGAVDVVPGGSSGGGSGSGSSGSGSGGGARASRNDRVGTASGEIQGQLLVTTETFQGSLLETFAADLQALPTSTPSSRWSWSCPATATVGACCVFPPIRPPPTQPPGSGTGAVDYGASAGALALLDVTSSATVDTFDFGSKGYQRLPASYYAARWQPGDVLSVSATGDQIGAFTVSAPALIPPVMQFPERIVAGKSFQITWQPDPNADTLMIQLLDVNAGSVVVACSAPDSDGTLTVDASLLSTFKSGDSCSGGADRETTRYAQTPTGRVAFRSFGYGESVRVPVE
jgi:hypothetical protein